MTLYCTNERHHYILYGLGRGMTRGSRIANCGMGIAEWGIRNTECRSRPPGPGIADWRSCNRGPLWGEVSMGKKTERPWRGRRGTCARFGGAYTDDRAAFLGANECNSLMDNLLTPTASGGGTVCARGIARTHAHTCRGRGRGGDLCGNTVPAGAKPRAAPDHRAVALRSLATAGELDGGKVNG